MLEVVPLTLKQANASVDKLHRHHKPVTGHRFSIGCVSDGVLVGAAIVGRPKARLTEQYSVAEVTRLVTDGTKNACSVLYSAAARAAREMGFAKIQTFILEEESGTSLIASGWKFESFSEGGDWNRPSRGGRRLDQPMQAKIKFSKTFKEKTKWRMPAADTVTDRTRVASTRRRWRRRASSRGAPATTAGRSTSPRRPRGRSPWRPSL